MLEIRAITKSFAAAPVLSGIDLSIAAGEFFALLGPSGCGKTTLLRLLGGLERPDKGEIHLDGQRIDQLAPNERPCHMVFQRYALFPHLNVRRNVGFALQKLSRRERDERVDEVLHLVEMQAYSDRRISELSGGQQQRIALARALAGQPRFLLLDEPLSALDLKLRQRMQVELVNLQRRLSLTFIFVTHDQEEALTLADRIAVMQGGRIEQVGTPQELYHQPQTAFVAQFIGQVNELSGRLMAADTAEVDGLGLLPVSSTGAKPGDRLRVMVRPEQWRLAELGAGSGGVEVSIEHLLFKGPHVEAIVRPKLRPDLRLTVHIADGTALRLRAGGSYSLSWPIAAHVYAADLATV